MAFSVWAGKRNTGYTLLYPSPLKISREWNKSLALYFSMHGTSTLQEGIQISGIPKSCCWTDFFQFLVTFKSWDDPKHILSCAYSLCFSLTVDQTVPHIFVFLLLKSSLPCIDQSTACKFEHWYLHQWCDHNKPLQDFQKELHTSTITVAINLWAASLTILIVPTGYKLFM